MLDLCVRCANTASWKNIICSTNKRRPFLEVDLPGAKITDDFVENRLDDGCFVYLDITGMPLFLKSKFQLFVFKIILISSF